MEMCNPNQKFVISHSKPYLIREDYIAIQNVMKSKMIAEGETVNEFEKAIAEYLGIFGGVATSSGTMALFLALKALNISKRDEVIIPTYVCRAVLDAVNYIHATPVLCDVGENWCMNLETVKPLITERTKAIIIVHTFGISADVKSMTDLNIPIIEDSCQSFGGSINGKKLGTFGNLNICSFNATKLLTTGEGGMVLTNDEALLTRVQELKFDQDQNYKTRYLFPMTNIQAALGLSQLTRYNEFLNRRDWIAEQYFNSFKQLPIQLPENIRECSIFFRFPILTQKNFKDLQKNFDDFGIQVRRGVDELLHLKLGLKPGTFPTAEKLYDQTLSIPIYPALTNEEVEYIIEVTNNIF